MKNIKTTLAAIAIGLTFSASALGQYPSPQDAISEQAVQSRSPAAAAANKVTSDRLDALYESTKKQCATHPVASQAYCLNQMRAGFGR
jgi:hypothetical protein